jgi:hypothetical protein
MIIEKTYMINQRVPVKFKKMFANIPKLKLKVDTSEGIFAIISYVRGMILSLINLTETVVSNHNIRESEIQTNDRI